jgi:hypothetical protein
MKYEFNRVIEGLSRYIESEIYSTMNERQDFAARVFVGRIMSNPEAIKQKLADNLWAQMLDIVDEDGLVDVDSLVKDIKRELMRRRELPVSIPLLGIKMKFKPNDIDVIYKHITGEEMNHHNEEHTETRRLS